MVPTCHMGAILSVHLYIIFITSLALTAHNQVCKKRGGPPLFSIIVLGDLHGDLNNTLAILRAVNVLSTFGMDPYPGKTNTTVDNWDVDQTQLRWIGGNNVVVQLGDIVDRGPDAPLILRLFDKLNQQAARQNGAVHHLFGNHEVMNLCHDHRSLSQSELEVYFNGDLNRWKKEWSPSGWTGSYVRKNFNVVKVLLGRILFVHAGLMPAFAKFSPSQLKSALLHRIDVDSCSFPTEQRGTPPHTYKNLKQRGSLEFDILHGNLSPAWSRESSKRDEKTACRLAHDALLQASQWKDVKNQENHFTMEDTLVARFCSAGSSYTKSSGLKFMIVGHTPVMLALGKYDPKRLNLVVRCSTDTDKSFPRFTEINGTSPISYIMADAGISPYVANNMKFLKIDVSLSSSTTGYPSNVSLDFWQVAVNRKLNGELSRVESLLISYQEDG